MATVLRAKFQAPELRRKLLATGDRELIEGNNWRDTTWGCIRDKEGNWKGRNELGKLLMQIRDELRAEEGTLSDEKTIEIPDAQLVQAARDARKRAYVPYSKYQVGAALLTKDGHIVTGCNVENASYGLCNCAERTAVFRAIAEGVAGTPPEFVAVAVATEDGGTPCGACRQVLSEFLPRDGSPLVVLLVNAAGEVTDRTSLQELLPKGFVLR
jgi:cytidine deaminase